MSNEAQDWAYLVTEAIAKVAKNPDDGNAKTNLGTLLRQHQELVNLLDRKQTDSLNRAPRS